MTHSRALLVALACAVLFAAGYSMLVPHGARGWGSIEIVDISVTERSEEGVELSIAMRFPGAQLGAVYRFLVEVRSPQCEIIFGTLSSERREYGQGDRVESVVVSPECAADDYEMVLRLIGVRGQDIARDTMRFSVPASP